MATAAQVDSRHRRRRSLFKGACAVIVGIPLALAAATTDVAPSSRPVSELARSQSSPSGALFRAAFVLNRVPDTDAAGGRPCVMVPDCRYSIAVYP